MRYSRLGWVVASVVVMGTVIGVGASRASASPTQLVLSQNEAFSVLGYWCGGITEHVFATQFDPVSGYPDGAAYLSTTCNGSGRGGISITHTAWATASWDLTGAVISYAKATSTPVVNPTLSVFDVHGNELYNASNQAYLALAPGFTPAPRITGLSVTDGPATGGTSVTVSGTGFTGVTAVSFGTAPAASFVFNGDTSVTAVTPSTSAGTVDVTLTTAGGANALGASDQFTFVAAPVVSGIAPTSGPLSGGTPVTISGANLSAATGVSFGDSPAGFVVNADGTLTAYSTGETTPDTVEVTVTSIGGTSGLTPNDVFTYTGVATGTPGAPTAVSASAGDTTAAVSFTPPASDGGSPITSYTVLATDVTDAASGGQSASDVAGPITVTGLVDGDTYSFTVTAANVNGPGPASAASNPVVPTSSAAPSFQILTSSLPVATLGMRYRTSLQAAGGLAPYRWKALTALPLGFRLHADGLLTGRPNPRHDAVGLYLVTVQASTKATRSIPAVTATESYTLQIQ